MKARRSRERTCELTREEARKLFDRQARKYLNMSGDKFVQKWKAGKFNGKSDSANILHVAMLLPFAR